MLSDNRPFAALASVSCVRGAGLVRAGA